MDNEVIINIKAVDEASSVIQSISTQLKELGKMELSPINIKNIDVGGEKIRKIVDVFSNLKSPDTFEFGPKIAKQIDYALKVGKKYEHDFSGMMKRLNEKGIVPEGLTSFDIEAKQIAAFQKELDSLNVEPIGTLDQWLENAGISMRQFQIEMGDMWVDLGRGQGFFNKLTGEVVSYQKAISIATMKTKRFKFEFLSVLFAGMALDRVFGGLLRSQFELWGVTEELSATWALVLAPTMEWLTALLFPLLEWFMNLPEPVKAAIGVFVLLGAGIGKLLSFIGQLYLGIMGLKMAWPTMAGAASKAFGILKAGFSGIISALSGIVTWVATTLGVSVGAAVAIIAAIIVAVIALVVGAIEAWKNNFLGFRDAVIGIWNAIKTVIQGFVEFWKGVWNVLVGIFTLNGDKIKEGFKQIGEGVKKMFIGVVNFVISLFNALIGLVISAVAQIVRFVQWIWNKIPGHKDVTWYEDIMKWGKDKSMIPTFQQGGIMPYTGLAYLHAGETVTPRGENVNTNFAPTINVYANTNANSGDIARQVSEELNRQWAYKFQRSNIR